MPPVVQHFCVRCNDELTHTVQKTLGKVWYRCVRCGKRAGETARNDNA
jgi:DNA-directed RNA polymerase subunit RPC12/RpoP